MNFIILSLIISLIFTIFVFLLYKKSLQIQILKSKISELNITFQEQKKSMEREIELLSTHEQRLKMEFENLANKILLDNSKKISEQNQQNLEQILTPMQIKIDEFKKKVEDVYDKDSKDRAMLYYELKGLKALNLHLSTEANKLTLALKNDNKAQGIWGEMVLERVLESSGLRKDFEYVRELSLKDEEGRIFRPDVVVNLPENRHIVIDAKTSLKAYSEYVSLDDEELKKDKLKSHVLSVKEHIKTLSLKRYENLKGINSLDFIFMFLPVEGALMLALQSDANLYDQAYKQKIILVSPTTLLVALRAVENSWRYEKQAQNIASVYKRAEELYKKFNNFTQDLQGVGKSLSQANENYNQAFKKLSEGRGNLISQAHKLKEISNLKPKSQLDEHLVNQAIS